jgi:hypothetical protein
MKRLLPAILFIHSLSFAQPGPDSGHSLGFSNASTNRVNIPDAASFDHPDNNITIEAWVFPTAYGVSGGGGMIFSKLETDGTNEYYICLLSSGLLRFILCDNSATYYYTVSITTVPLNTWTHIAATYSFSTGIAHIYFNGILNISNNIGSIILNSTVIRPMIGAYWLSNNNVSRAHFEGVIDEVRLWHVERTQTQIRDNICQTLSPPLANLIAYYRLDETSGTFAADASGNGNNGTMENFAAGQIAVRNFSGAPVGNQSMNTYPATAPMTLASASGGSLTVDNITGSPTGFHVFRVDAKPSQTAGLTNPINTYFGTFVVGGTSPTYRVTYNYSGTSFDGSSCEGDFSLHQRIDNSNSMWVPLTNTLNTTSNTLTAVNADNTDRKEIIIDTACTLPVNFLSFDVRLTPEREVELDWVTTGEINNNYFNVEKSNDAVNFESIGQVNGQIFSNSLRKYTFLDDKVFDERFYYRIKQVDIDGKFSYSEIKSIQQKNNNSFMIYPNPGNGAFIVETNQSGYWEIKIQDNMGCEVYGSKNAPDLKSKNIELSYLAPGVYYIKISNANGATTKKLIIQ